MSVADSKEEKGTDAPYWRQNFLKVSRLVSYKTRIVHYVHAVEIEYDGTDRLHAFRPLPFSKFLDPPLVDLCFTAVAHWNIKHQIKKAKTPTKCFVLQLCFNCAGTILFITVRAALHDTSTCVWNQHRKRTQVPSMTAFNNVMTTQCRLRNKIRNV